MNVNDVEMRHLLQLSHNLNFSRQKPFTIFLIDSPQINNFYCNIIELLASFIRKTCTVNFTETSPADLFLEFVALIFESKLIHLSQLSD